MRVVCGITSCRDWKPQFGLSFAFMYGHTLQRGHEIGIEKLDIYAGAQQSCFSSGRQNIVNHALAKDYTHIAFFDDDMQFPPDTILRLAKHQKYFVCANATQKTVEVRGVCLDDKNQRIDSTRKSGLELVLYGSLGVALVDVRAIAIEPPPHFMVLYNQPNKTYVDADHYFFNKLGKLGVEFWCDHDLSKEVRHVGDYAYGFPQGVL